jgi:hypothetical protein
MHARIAAFVVIGDNIVGQKEVVVENSPEPHPGALL